MCSIIVFLNKIYYTYCDLHTRIILNNYYKFTLDIAEIVIFNVFKLAEFKFIFK